MIEEFPSPGPAVSGEPGEVFALIRDELTAASRPADLPRRVRQRFEGVVDSLGERWVGGPWDPRDDLWRHTISVLDDAAAAARKTLTTALGEWREAAAPDSPARLLFPLCAWWECSLLWDRSLAYRSMRVIAEAVAQVAGELAVGVERHLWAAISQAVQLLVADGETYREMNLSSPARLVHAARKGVSDAEEAAAALDQAIAAVSVIPLAPDGSCLIRQGLCLIREEARQTGVYYEVMADVAGTLTEFEQWIAGAPATAGEHPPGAAAGSVRPLAAAAAPRASVEASLAHLREKQRDLSGRILSECEPWEHLLAEIQRLIASGDDVGHPVTALVPRRLWVRYCYPFAVGDTEQPSAAHLHPGLARRRDGQTRRAVEPSLRRRLEEEFGDLLGSQVMSVGEPAELATTEFFQAAGSQDSLFGGVRVDLSPIVFTDGGLQGLRCNVWLDLNRMGNFCLCVEPTVPLEQVAPPELYRVSRAGTPFVYGERVALTRRPAGLRDDGGAPAWDNLQTFARDIIRATADACYWKTKKDTRSKRDRESSAVAPFVAGNLHLVAIVQTDAALGTQSEDVANRLDGAVGGRIVLSSVQRTASTVDEWIRFPPLQRGGTSSRGVAVAAVPEIGYAGDWIVHTGETTVFGIVAVAQWLRYVYSETAEFAGSWAPQLGLWGKRLQRCIDELKPADVRPGSAEELRRVEQRVRLHLSQINSEELCATLANRRFLDELLEMAGVDRLQRELEVQLRAAEQLTDWFSQHEEKRSARRRDIWLFIIAMLGIFSLADFMALANSTGLHRRFGFINLTDQGVWEDWFILAAFAVAFAAGLLYVLGGFGWLRRRFAAGWRRLRD